MFLLLVQSRSHWAHIILDLLDGINNEFRISQSQLIHLICKVSWELGDAATQVAIWAYSFPDLPILYSLVRHVSGRGRTYPCSPSKLWSSTGLRLAPPHTARLMRDNAQTSCAYVPVMYHAACDTPFYAPSVREVGAKTMIRGALKNVGRGRGTSSTIVITMTLQLYAHCRCPSVRLFIPILTWPHAHCFQ